MRQPDEMAWYEVDGEDGHPRACHGVKRLMPEGSKEISEGHAKQISADVRAREPKASQAAMANAAAAGVDLRPIQDQIDAIAAAVIGHAKTLDDHAAKISNQAEISQATKASVVEFMQNVKAGKTE